MRNGRNVRNRYKLGIALFVCLRAHAQGAAVNSYTQTDLASDIEGMARYVDMNLVNPWGLSATGSTFAKAIFVSDNGTGFATRSAGGLSTGWVTVPSASGTGAGTPTGSCESPGGAFNVFVTLDGLITEYTTGTAAVVTVNNSARGAVYTGCAEWAVSRDASATLYVANNAGSVEAYSQDFSPIALAPGAFVDPNVPAGFKPYGVYAAQGANGKIWVTYFNGTPGAGQGYVDAFDTSGKLLLSLAQGSWMNQPWGIAQASANFGQFSKTILVAMTGTGMIAAFNPTTGSFGGILKDSTGQYIVNSGLHGIAFGRAPYTTTLYFTAGIDGFAHGLFGSIVANTN